MGMFTYFLLLGLAAVHTWQLIGDRTLSHVSNSYQISICFKALWVQRYDFVIYCMSKGQSIGPGFGSLLGPCGVTRHHVPWIFLHPSYPAVSQWTT